MTKIRSIASPGQAGEVNHFSLQTSDFEIQPSSKRWDALEGRMSKAEVRSKPARDTELKLLASPKCNNPGRPAVRSACRRGNSLDFQLCSGWLLNGKG